MELWIMNKTWLIIKKPCYCHVFAWTWRKSKHRKATNNLWQSCDILSQGYPCTFRATENCIFLENFKCIIGYQMKDLLRVPLEFFYEIVCFVLKNWRQSARELREPMWGAKECPKFMIHSLSSISQKGCGLLLTQFLHLTRNRSIGK